MDILILVSFLAFLVSFFFVFLVYTKKISVLFPLFFLFLALTFTTGYFATCDEGLISDFKRDGSALLFFVFLIAIPPTLFAIIKNSYVRISIVKIEKYAFLPLILFGINMFSLGYLFFSGDKKTFTGELIENVITYVNYIALLFLFPLSSFFYIYNSLKIIHEFSNKKLISIYKSIQFQIVILFVLFLLFLFLDQIKVLPKFLHVSFSIYASFYLVGTSFLFYQLILKEKQEAVNKNEPPLFLSDEQLLLSAETMEVINTNLMRFLKEEQQYLDPNIKINNVAKEIGTNTKYLSYVINLSYQKSYSAFINDFRIEHAKELLSKKEYNQYTIETIAKMSGFNSKSLFNSVFKSATGQTPSEFKNH
jgi:AraC-like DNA-binding protein